MGRNKCTVTVSRHWNNPEIRTTVSSEEIRLEMSLEDFKEAVKQELLGKLDEVTKGDKFMDRAKYIFTGRVLTDCFMSSKRVFSKEMDKAFDKIVEGIKEESVKVI